MGQTSLHAPTARRFDRALLVILVLAFLLRAAVALHWPSNYQPDEIFQTQEPAHRMAFGYGVVTWEWRDGIRSYVYPFLLSLIMRVTAPLGGGSAPYLHAIALVMCALSLWPVWFCYRWADRVSGRTAALIAGGTAAIWFALVYFGPKTFNELAATDALLPALLLGTDAIGEEETQSSISRWRLPFAGLLCGLAVSLRPQFAPTVVFAALWICWRDPRKRLPRFLAGAAISLIVFGIVDAFTLGYPFASFVRYVWVNIGQGKAKAYGISPWYFFLPQLVAFCGPLLLLAIAGVRKSPFLGWLLLVLVGSHSVIAHKEFRFIFAAIPLIITLAAIGAVEFARWFDRSAPRLGARVRPFTALAALSFFALCSLWLGRRFERWHFASEDMIFTQAAGKDPLVCGVGVYGVSWVHAAGYTYLHRRLPLIFPVTDVALVSDSGQFNRLLTRHRLLTPPSGFELVSCGDYTCSYRREGSCSSPGRDEVNAMLSRTRQ